MTTLALIAWPLLILVLARRWPLPQVILISLIGGYLLLPTEGGWDLPMLPPLDKKSIPAFAALTAVFVARGVAPAQSRQRPSGSADDEQPGWLPRSPVAIVLLGLIVIGSFLTVLTNRDPLSYGPLQIPGLRLYDGFSVVMLTMVALLPLFLGRKFFARPDRHELLLHALVVAGVAYSLLALYEIRMSPQLNNIVYGYFPHSWHQHVRGGGLGWGWRPLVFLRHGLALAIFLAVAALAAFGSSRFVHPSRKMFYLIAGGWLLLTLLLSTSLGALIIALMFLPIVLLVGARTQLVIAAIVAAIVLTYPMLRNVDAFPTEPLVSVAADIDYGRSRSLAFRFEHEDALLEHARERPFFGWGSYGRNRIYDEQGRNQSVTDGFWVILFGHGGWTGYIGEFGLLTLPIIILAFRRRRYDASPATSLLALILAANLVDLIPNGFTSPMLFLAAGALIGRLELERVADSEPETAGAAPARSLAYARGSPQPSAGLKEEAPETSEQDQSGSRTPVYSRQTVRRRRVGNQN